jgi:hypothetical protein
MKATTPFFPLFRGQLFGRPPRSARERLRQEARQLQRASLGKLTGLFAHYIPPSLLAPTAKGAGSRQRIFSTRTTFWAFLAQVLSPQSSCRETLRKLQAWQAACTSQMASSSSTSAYCQARSRLSLDWLKKIHERVAAEVHKRSFGDQEFGRPVKVIDGTSASMPDTPANQKRWPQTKAQKPGCGFPFVKLVGLFHLSNGVLIDWAEGSKHDHEAKLFPSLWKHLYRGDVLLGDRGFCSYAAMAALWSRGVDTLMRKHQALKLTFRSGKRLGPRDRLICMKRPLQPVGQWSKSEWKKLPSTLMVRMVEIRVRQPGFRVQRYVVLTTLTDPQQWPLERLGQLYFKRWSVELFFRDIKISMGMDVLRCKSPAMVRKEIVMHAIAYNCIRGIMQRAAATYEAPLERISFKGTVDALRQWADAIHIHHDKPRKQAEMINVLLRLLAEDTVPLRPDRVEPRVKKRRPKGYQLMTRPRHEMVVSDSRRRK